MFWSLRALPWRRLWARARFLGQPEAPTSTWLLPPGRLAAPWQDGLEAPALVQLCGPTFAATADAALRGLYALQRREAQAYVCLVDGGLGVSAAGLRRRGFDPDTTLLLAPASQVEIYNMLALLLLSGACVACVVLGEDVLPSSPPAICRAAVRNLLVALRRGTSTIVCTQAGQGAPPGLRDGLLGMCDVRLSLPRGPQAGLT